VEEYWVGGSLAELCIGIDTTLQIELLFKAVKDRDDVSFAALDAVGDGVCSMIDNRSLVSLYFESLTIDDLGWIYERVPLFEKVVKADVAHNILTRMRAFVEETGNTDFLDALLGV